MNPYGRIGTSTLSVLLMFDAKELIRYSRQIMLHSVGLEGQQQLKAARVLVIGAGGLGCPLMQYLVSAGVGIIGIVDFDTVELHNLHRQVLYKTEDVGKFKAETAAYVLTQLNPSINIITHNELLTEENAASLIKAYDIIADGSDNFLTRYVVNDTCVSLNKPLVYGSILLDEGQLAVFNYKGSKNLRDIFPEPPAAEDVPNCSETGVLGVVPGILGTMMAERILKIITGGSIDVDTLFLINLGDYSIKKLRF
jgi:molybdopterin-synthase adenylyltransferase